MTGGLRALAVPLMTIANEIRWLASGPRCGLGELDLPANEPGSPGIPLQQGERYSLATPYLRLVLNFSGAEAADRWPPLTATSVSS
jgi:hypothetical protein